MQTYQGKQFTEFFSVFYSILRFAVLVNLRKNKIVRIPFFGSQKRPCSVYIYNGSVLKRIKQFFTLTNSIEILRSRIHAQTLVKVYPRPKRKVAIEVIHTHTNKNVFLYPQIRGYLSLIQLYYTS